jgi:hypothetical protein
MAPPNGLKLHDNLGACPRIVEDDNLWVGLQKVVSKAAQVGQLLHKQRIGDLRNEMGLPDPGTPLTITSPAAARMAANSSARPTVASTSTPRSSSGGRARV